MATNLDKLPVCVKLFRQLTEFNWKNTSYFEADLTGDSKTWSLLQDLDSVDCIESISINGEQKEFSLIKESDVIDSVLNISVYYPHNLFSQSLDDLLKKDIKNYHTIPENFYIAECDYFHSEGSEPPEEISDYFCAIEFIKLLKGQADFETNTGELKLFFLTQKKLEISVKYRTNNIKGFGSLKCFSLLKSTISDGLYVGEKNHILKLNLIKSLDNRMNGNSLCELFDHFQEFYQSFSADYELFMSNFSFDKLVDKIETNRADFTKKINDSLVSIQGKILAIPVSLILVANQIKYSKTLIASNSFVLLGCFVFTIFMYFLIKTQYINLLSVKSEIDTAHKNLSKYKDNITEKFTEVFDTLNNQYDRSKCIFIFVFGIALLGFALTVWVYLYNTPVAWKWICKQVAFLV